MLRDPDQRADSSRRLEQLATEGAETRVTLDIARADGSDVAVDIIGRTVRDPKTGELEIVAVAREATERLKAEGTLATVEERFRELVEWLPAVVYEADTGPEGAFHYVSPQITELLGYSADEWTSDPSLWRQRLHAEEVDRVLELEHDQELEAREAGGRLASEYRMIHRSGRIVWVRDIARLCPDEHGSLFWRGVLTDITAERQAQISLADAHERHRTMVEDLPACVYQAERRAMGRWHFVSSQIERLLGYTAEEWKADPTLWRASLHADDRERVEFDEQRHLESPPGTELVSEYRLRHRTGRPVWVRDRAVLSVSDNGERMIDGILTDITAERAAAAGAEGRADVYRLTCNDCGETWPAAGVEHCRNVPEPERGGRLAERDARRPGRVAPAGRGPARRHPATPRGPRDEPALERHPGSSRRRRTRQRRSAPLTLWACATASGGSGRRAAASPVRTVWPSSQSATPPTTTGTSSATSRTSKRRAPSARC